MQTNSRSSLGGIAPQRFALSALRFLVLAVVAWKTAPASYSQDLLDPKGDPNSKTSTSADMIVRKIDQITQEYKEFLERRKEMHTTYEKIQKDLRQSEAALNRIGNQEIRQQMAAMQSMMQSASIDLALSSMATVQPNNNFQARRQNIIARQLLTDRMLEDMNVTMRGQSILQLDAAAQEVIQNRYQRFQDAAKLDQQWGEWQAQWPSFMDKYWNFTDPERKFTSEEVNQAIAALERCDAEDYAAKIATSLLLERAGRINAGLEIIDPVLEAKTGLQPVALAAKAMLLSAVDKDKEATSCIQSAFKLQRDNPYLHWMRATLAASQEQWGAADTELKRLAPVKPMELAVRRLSALIHAARAAKTPAEGKKAILDAQAAIDMEPQPSWYSYLVLAVAQASAKDKAAALGSLEKAESKADEGSRAWCNQLQEALERGDAIDWKFDRRLADVD
jgi:hypothetical protein